MSLVVGVIDGVPHDVVAIRRHGAASASAARAAAARRRISGAAARAVRAVRGGAARAGRTASAACAPMRRRRVAADVTGGQPERAGDHHKPPWTHRRVETAPAPHIHLAARARWTSLEERDVVYPDIERDPLPRLEVD